MTCQVFCFQDLHPMWIFLRDFMNFVRWTAPINGHANAMKMKTSQIKELALKLFASVFSGNK